MFLDEPTSGLDINVRQDIWQLIQQIREGKSIILTTHCMEEAEALSDRLAIIVKGRLKCIGTSLGLKQELGGKYKMILNIKNDSFQNEIIQFIQKEFHSVQLVSQGEGQIVF